jgi:hypothetical protein
MIEYVILIFCIVNLALLLCVCNIVMDIKEYLMYGEMSEYESDLRDN